MGVLMGSCNLIVVLISKLKMSFKSMQVHWFWSICLEAFGSRLRLQWVVDNNNSMKTIDDSKQSCWDNLPPDLLTDILMRIEVSESDWPSRKNVVSCAGVCRSWRKIMQEIVKCRQLSDKLTFPVSLKQPGSAGSLRRCIMIRDPDIAKQIYYLFLHQIQKHAPKYQPGKFLLAAKRVSCATCTEYIISLNYKDISKGSSSCIGVLRSNFLGTKFRIYDVHTPSCYPISSISYEVNALGNGGPRQMQCEINTIPANSFPLPHLFKLKDVKLVLKNTTSRRQSQFWRWCLYFIGRVTFDSVKKLKLVACLDNEAGVKEHENIILNFKKVIGGLFVMEYQYPISVFQAFAICLSTFDTKVACE